MQDDSDTLAGPDGCVVEASATAADAGAMLVLGVRVHCAALPDLRGETLLIKDDLGAVVAEAAISAFDGESSLTDDFTVKVPPGPGDCAWWAVVPARRDGPLARPEIATRFTFAVRPHATWLAVWDVPATVTAGVPFRLKVGMKCSSGCDMNGCAVGVYDEAGDEVATIAIGGAIWPRSSGLHYVEAELPAPATVGYHTWEIRVAGSDDPLPHRAAVERFGLTTVVPAECRVNVTAIDATTRAPITRAKVVLHPYRALTDAQGVAALGVAKGVYRMFVSAARYQSIERLIEAAHDVATMAELVPEPPEDPAAPYR